MPKMKELQKVLVLGSGPIEIGQAAEFDYAGTQACQALKEEGVEVILLNSNPATIMTDPEMANKVYIEPLTVEVIEKIVHREQPDGILATTGGQTGLNLAMELEKTGILRRYNIPILGTDVAAIQKAEDRSDFRQLMHDLEQPVPVSSIIQSLSEAEAFVSQVGLPVVVRPAYTLGGSGGGLAQTAEELKKYIKTGLRQSPIKQVLLEQSIAGLSELEYEVVRDNSGAAIIVCDMENIDPVGVHTGDSMVVAPVQTLNQQQKQILEQAALWIVSALNVVGSCNVQFAFNPKTNQYYVIEVNPRVSRSSALASKATGYPIARVAAKVALGYTLAELQLDQRPQVDYIVTKIPRWPFDKFAGANRHLGTQMKATGEVMAIGKNLAESLQKAVRSLELDWDSLFDFPNSDITDDKLEQRLQRADDQRLFLLVEALKRGYSVAQINGLTKIRVNFLQVLDEIVAYYQHLYQLETLDVKSLRQAKELGFSDATIATCVSMTAAQVRQIRLQAGIKPQYAVVKSGAMPYYYSTYDSSLDQPEQPVSEQECMIVLGSGPIRIGQGIEFDYATVHAAWAIRKQGYDAVIINNNPETVSTDSNTSTRLYFEPLTCEDVLNVIAHEDPQGVVVQFGGQTAINLCDCLEQHQVSILGTSVADVNRMEDRRQFDANLEILQIPRPKGVTAASKQEAVEISRSLIYPVVARPSFVLGGRGMEVIHNHEELEHYLIEFSQHAGYPLLMDSYLAGIEIEVDAICDGTDVFVPGIMEHLERAGVHSGDSIAAFPAQTLLSETVKLVYEYTKQLALHFKVKGFINIQYVLAHDKLYVLEVNPRASRTVPFLSKATGISLAGVATKAALGISLKEQGYVGLRENHDPVVCVKVPVFSFAKLQGMEVSLGPEMKSTGEVMGRGKTLAKALYKGFIACSVKMPQQGKVLLTVADKDKADSTKVAKRIRSLGLQLYATAGTANYLQSHGIECAVVAKLDEGNDIIELITNNSVDMVINTITIGKQPQRDGFRIRTAAIENGVLCFTILDTVQAYLDVVEDQELWLEPLQ